MDLASDSQLIVFFPVRDLAATRDFYARDLGLTLVRERDGCLVFGAPGSGRVGFFQHDDGAPIPSHEGLVLVLSTSDVDAAYRRLRRVGVETERLPGQRDAAGTLRFSTRDPDGYRVEVRRSLPSDSDATLS